MGFMQCSVHADSRPFSHSLPPFCKPTQRQLTDHRIPVEPHSDGCSLDGGLLSAYNCDLLDQSSLFALDLACLVLAGQGLLHAVVSLAGPDGTPHIGQSFPVQDLAVRKVTGRLDPADREKGRGDAWASCRESDSHPGVYVRPSRSIQHRGRSLFSLYSPQLLDGRGVGSARNHLGEFFTECSLWGCCQRLPLHGSVCPKHHVPAVT